MNHDSNLTIGAVSRGAGLCDSTIRKYAQLGLIACRVDSTGRRLFNADAADQARRVYDERRRNFRAARIASDVEQ